MKKIVFLVQDDNCGATFMLGKMVKYGLDHYNTPCEIKQINELNTIKDSLVIIFKHQPPANAISQLKENNNKLVMDVVDEFIRPGTTPENLYDYSLFDGVIIRIGKVLKEHIFPSHLEIKFIPHHWDIRLQDLDTSNKLNSKPLVNINDGRDMPYLEMLVKNNIIDFVGNYSYSQYSKLIDKLNSYFVHYNVRNTNSLAYKYKPSTKLVTSSALDAPLITNYDWAIQDLIPPDYPFLIEGKNYEELVDMISMFPSQDSKEYKYALQLLKEVKAKTALINLIPEYLEFYNRF